MKTATTSASPPAAVPVTTLLPVMAGFFIMGFVDVVGISSTYVKRDFSLSDTFANFLPMMVFLWFALFSVPTGLMMNRLGRKKTVVISMAVTLASMLIPFVAYRYFVVLIAFGLLGIGNTILQVSLNPLITNIVSGRRLTSSLTFGQFIKATASFLGPIIAGIAAGINDWKYIFPVFVLVTLVFGFWLVLTPVREETNRVASSSFGRCFGLLGDKTILLLFLGILFVVGIDVGLNTCIPKLLMERANISLEKAGLGTSLYFAARTIGTFVGAIMLVKIAGRSFFIASMALACVSLIAILFLGNLWAILVMVFITGLAIANVFSIIFSLALQRMPDRANEISGLMIMGVSGGAVVPVFMGMASDTAGTQAGGFSILILAAAYLLFSALRIRIQENGRGYE